MSNFDFQVHDVEVVQVKQKDHEDGTSFITLKIRQKSGNGATEITLWNNGEDPIRIVFGEEG